MSGNLTIDVLSGVPDPIRITLDLGDKTILMDLSMADARELMHFLAHVDRTTSNGDTLLWIQVGYGRECRVRWRPLACVNLDVFQTSQKAKYFNMGGDAAICLSKAISKALTTNTKYADLVNSENHTDLLDGANKRMNDNLRSVFG